MNDRVPRSLLPGARSSRLKDRQKEERELSVKNAFVEDILKENHMLTMLLQKNPSYRVVLWNVDLLPSSIKDSELCSTINTDGTKTREYNHPGKCDSQDLYTQMSLYMDAVTDFYVDDADDIQNDYQVDSGTLPCVACGILGFPFMAVVQPSEQASRDLLSEDQDMIPRLGVYHPVGSKSLDLDCRAQRSTPGIRPIRHLIHDIFLHVFFFVKLSISFLSYLLSLSLGVILWRSFSCMLIENLQNQDFNWRYQ